MKKPKINNITEYYVCEECKKEFKHLKILSNHIGKYHNSNEYYNNYLNDESLYCPICDEPKKFASIGYGYNKTCGKKECSHKMTTISNNKKWYNLYGMHPNQTKKVKELRVENHIKKYGVAYNWQREDIKKKIKETNIKNNGGMGWASPSTLQKMNDTILEKYGDSKYRNLEKSKRTKFANHGNETYTNREQAGKTNLERYGNLSPLWGAEQIKLKKETWMKNYGVEYPMQHPDIFNKSFKTRIQIHNYKETELTYQSLYELDFLDKYSDNFKIENGPSISYVLDSYIHVYHSDFFIPSLNLVVEIKNSYLMKTYKEEIEAKEKATKEAGYNYCIIIDKRYSKFLKLING